MMVEIRKIKATVLNTSTTIATIVEDKHTTNEGDGKIEEKENQPTNERKIERKKI